MKIFDCIPFFNELDLLDIRLRMLNDVVDHFVIAELTKTYTGNDKPRIFAENRERFKEYEDKIIYVSPDFVPDYAGFSRSEINHYQKNCLLSGYNGLAEEDDIILISDVDEIPDPGVLKALKETDFKTIQDHKSTTPLRQLARLYASMGWKRFMSTMLLHKHHNVYDLLDFSPVVFRQKMYHFYINLEAEKRWSGTVMAKAKMYDTPTHLRQLRSKLPMIENGGYHFSYVGGADRVKEKMNAIMDGYEVNDAKSMEKLITECLKTGKGAMNHEEAGDYKLIDKKDIGLQPDILEYVEKNYPYLFFEGGKG